MTGTLKKIECDPKCGFSVQSHDEKEVIKIAQEHGKKFHKMELSENDVKKMMKSVKAS